MTLMTFMTKKKLNEKHEVKKSTIFVKKELEQKN